jgi:trigger factor
MKVEVQHLSPVKKSMSVEVEPEVAARELHTVLRGYASKARIPGFRPGKAPISVVRSHFGREVDEDLRERMVARYYTKAAREEGLEPLGNPVLEEVDFDEGRPFRFKTTFEVLPPVEPTGYKGIELRRRKP